MPLDFSLESDFVQRLLIALGLSLLVYILIKVGQRLAKRYGDDPARIYYTSRFIGRVGGLVIIIVLVSIISPRLGDLVTVLTIFGTGLAIAMREVLLNIAGWFYITVANAYRQGDRIDVNGIQGDVIDIRVMRTTVMEIRGWVEADQSTGRISHIPNGWTLYHAVYNYTRGFNFIWNELSVTLTFRSDWQKAQSVMQHYAEESTKLVEHQAANEIRQMSREFLIHYSILSPFVYVKIVENGVRLTLRYLCDVRKRRGTEHALTISLLEAFKQEPGIELAYPMIGVRSFDGPHYGPLSEPLYGPTDTTSDRSSSI